MTSISRIYSAQPVSEEAYSALAMLDEELKDAINKAREAGILQGFLVSVLAAHFHQQTAAMLAMGDE